jgi:hypothetical protein
LTGDQRHRNDITNGQHLNRHADRPYVFYFFPTAHFLKTILCQPASGTFGFTPPHKADPSQSQKSHFFSYADKHIVKLDNKMLKTNVQYIARFSSIKTTFDTLNNLTAGATL